MARGSEGKSARKQARKEARAKEAERILAGEEDLNEFSNTSDNVNDGPNVEEDSSSDEDESAPAPETTPEKKKKKKSKSARAKKAVASAAAKDPRDACCAPPGGSGEGIKTLPLIMLIMLTGTTVLPALLYMGDYLSAYLQKNHIMGNFGHRLGIGPSPKKRVISFYEKHDPDKLNEVPTILAKYYGDYPKLTKRLERKYQE
eukprot:885539_1